MLDETVQALRSLVNNHRRVTKTTTRLTNRLHAYVHSIHPLLDIKYSTWLGWANSHGLIDPADIHSFLASEEARTMDGRRLVHLQKLAQYLPFITASTASYNEIMRTIGQLATAEAEVKSLAADIEQMVTAPPFAEVTRRLLTIPTANATEIATFHVAAHGLLDQLTPDEFKACIGIAARSNTSGSIDRTRAQKGGYTPAKDALWMLATRLMHPNQRPNSLYTYHERLKARPDKNKEFRATRAKLAQIISGVARSPEGYKS